MSKTMKKKAKVMAVVIAVLMVLFALVVYIKFAKTVSDMDEAGDGDYNVIGAETTAPIADSFDMFPLGEPSETTATEQTTTATYKDEDFDVDEDFLYMPYELYKVKDSKVEGILAQVRSFDMDALTVIFDNVEFKPGLYVRDIIDTSYWYTLRENDTVQPNSSEFLRLKNDFWDDKAVKLVDKNDATNGNIILWVHNYSDEPALIRDCMIYKYQISYLGSWEQYSEHPTLDYLGKYTFGSTELPVADSVTGVTLDEGECLRHVYGDVSLCQVLLDKTDDDGLIAITVSYNEYYGPDFDSKGE